MLFAMSKMESCGIVLLFRAARPPLAVVALSVLQVLPVHVFQALESVLLALVVFPLGVAVLLELLRDLLHALGQVLTELLQLAVQVLLEAAHLVMDRLHVVRHLEIRRDGDVERRRLGARPPAPVLLQTSPPASVAVDPLPAFGG